ncbi:MAG: LPS translocon maturation chaperone LptM [Parvibaculales bacterium]
MRPLIYIFMAASLTVGLSACGKRGALSLPEAAATYEVRHG